MKEAEDEEQAQHQTKPVGCASILADAHSAEDEECVDVAPAHDDVR
jgi:hypothetical protein